MVVVFFFFTKSFVSHMCCSVGEFLYLIFFFFLEFACEDCVDSFVTEVALNKHKIFHTKEDFTCQKCNKAFSNQNALSTHEKRHSLRMNYTCQICKETVSTRAKFQKHIKDHLGKS